VVNRWLSTRRPHSHVGHHLADVTRHQQPVRRRFRPQALYDLSVSRVADMRFLRFAPVTWLSPAMP
jgi:hypothetical protein